MDTLSFLFWTLVALLAVLMFAIEAGSASRHRYVVMCTIASTFTSVIYIMFFIDDRTVFDIKPSEDGPKKRGNRKESSNSGDGGGGGGAQGSKKSGGKDSADSGDDPGDGEINKPAPAKSDADLGKIFEDCPECPTMIRVPAGQFLMGSPDIELGRTAIEGPQRRISIDPEFSVGRFPITRDQFTTFAKMANYSPAAGCVVNGRFSSRNNWQSPGFEQSGGHPVVCITLSDATAYIKWLETRANKQYRLLSEAEWEYVARAGTTAAYWRGAKLPSTEFNTGQTRDGTAPTGATPSNDFGIYDVHGNAAQLVEDCWSPQLANLPADGNPYATQLAGSCRRGVVRGGHWASRVLEARSAMRWVVPDSAIGHNTIGFRVARDVTAPAPK